MLHQKLFVPAFTAAGHNITTTPILSDHTQPDTKPMGGATFITDLLKNSPLSQQGLNKLEKNKTPKLNLMKQKNGGGFQLGNIQQYNETALSQSALNSARSRQLLEQKSFSIFSPSQDELAIEKEKMLRWMKIQENAQLRENLTKQHFFQLHQKYETRVKQIESKLKEEQEHKQYRYKQAQTKRNKVKSQRDNELLLKEQESYRSYIDTVVKRKNSEIIQGQSKRSKQNHSQIVKSKSKQQDLGDLQLNKHNSHYSVANDQEQDEYEEIDDNMNEEEYLANKLLTIEEKMNRSIKQKRQMNEQLSHKARQHSDHIETIKLAASKLKKIGKLQRWQQVLQKQQKASQILNQTQSHIQEKIEEQRQKMAMSQERSKSTHKQLDQERQQRMSKLVTQYHQQITEQVEEIQKQRKTSSKVKKALNEEWFKMYNKNSQLLKSKQIDYQRNIIEKHISSQIIPMQMKEYQQKHSDFSRMSNFFRQTHKSKLIMSQDNSPRKTTFYNTHHSNLFGSDFLDQSAKNNSQVTSPQNRYGINYESLKRITTNKGGQSMLESPNTYNRSKMFDD